MKDSVVDSRSQQPALQLEREGTLQPQGGLQETGRTINVPLEKSPRPQRWYVTQQCQSLGQQFRRDCCAIDRIHWQRWLTTILIGWIAVAGFLVLLTLGMRFALEQGYLSNAWEQMALNWVLDNAPVNFSRAVWLGAAGDPIVIIPVFIIGTVVVIRAGYPLQGLSVAAAYLLVSLLVLLGWTIWDRARPTLVVDGMAAPDLHSFPSGHMAQSTAVYGMLWYFWLQRIHHRSETVVALLLLALWISLVALSRLVLGAHWVTDIIAGILVGSAWLVVLIYALRRALPTQQEQRSMLAQQRTNVAD